jgi:hypothetical protein
LVVTSLVLAGGVLLGRWLAQSAAASKADDGEVEPEGDAAATKTKGAEPLTARARVETNATAQAKRFDRFPCKPGDVLLRHTGEEAWLAGGWLFSEDAPHSALFVAPAAAPATSAVLDVPIGRERFVFVRAAAGGEVLFLARTEVNAPPKPAEPPLTVEHDGHRFERVRRFPLAAEVFGEGAEALGDHVVVGEYRGPGRRRLLLVFGDEGVFAYAGDVLTTGDYEVLPGAAEDEPRA